MEVSKDLHALYALKEICEDLISEVYAEAPEEYFPTLRRASEIVAKAETVEELLKVFDLIGMGRDHAYAYLRSVVRGAK